MSILKDIHSIETLLQEDVRSVKRIVVSRKPNPRIQKLVEKARSLGVFQETDSKLTSSDIVAHVRDFEFLDEGLLLSRIQKEPIIRIVLLDELQDPQNLGSILRSASFFDFKDVVLTEHRSATITPTVARVASGGVADCRIYKVTNLNTFIGELKEAGVWILGLSEHAETELSQLEPPEKCAIAIGNEEKGLRRIILESCDFQAKISSFGAVKSLNAHVAASIGFFWHNSRLRS